MGACWRMNRNKLKEGRAKFRSNVLRIEWSGAQMKTIFGWSEVWVDYVFWMASKDVKESDIVRKERCEGRGGRVVMDSGQPKIASNSAVKM